MKNKFVPGGGLAYIRISVSSYQRLHPMHLFTVFFNLTKNSRVRREKGTEDTLELVENR